MSSDNSSTTSADATCNTSTLKWATGIGWSMSVCCTIIVIIMIIILFNMRGELKTKTLQYTDSKLRGQNITGGNPESSTSFINKVLKK